MVLPVHDLNPTRTTPWITRALILINVVVFALSPLALSPLIGSASPASVCRESAYLDRYAAKPDEVIGNSPDRSVTTGEVGRDAAGRTGCVVSAPTYQKNPVLSVLYAMFLHGGWLHLLGNMLFLFVFGNNIEDRLGKLRYLAFYLGCGYVATYGFSLFFAGSDQPLVGASGAIAGVLGAYLVLYPRARVWSLLTFLFFLPVRLPAWLVLGSWFVLQYLYARGAGLSADAGTAYLAHVVGFLVGAVVVWPLHGSGRHRGLPHPRWGPYARR